MVNPGGIDTDNPRFTWQITSEIPGIGQSAYKIHVGTDSALVASGRGEVWESGKVKSSTIPAVYSGPPLQPFTRYFWNVRIRQRNGGWTSLSETAAFETGYMHIAPWKGHWITDTYDYNLKPAPYFRKELNI